MKKGNELLLSKDDYEFYKIPLPFSSLTKKNLNRHISVELGKLHPCFSDDCKYETKVSLGKKGFFADVLVMNKYCLDDYKSRFPRKKIRAEEFSRKVLFKEKKSGKPGKSILLGSLALVLLAFCSASYKIYQLTTKTVATKNSYLMKMESIPSPYMAIPEYKNLLKNFFEITREANGRITGFLWKQNGENEILFAAVKGLYPEQFEGLSNEINFSTLSFQKDVPFFTITASNRCEKVTTTVNANEITNSQNKTFKASLRETIKQNNGKIIEETVNPLGITFEWSPYENKNNFFDKIAACSKENNFSVKELNIQPESSGDFKISIIFEEGSFSTLQILNLIEENKDLFFETVIEKSFLKEYPTEEKSNRNNLVIKEKNNKSLEKSYVEGNGKIGKVVHKDGSTISFYKDNSGRIEIRREQ